MKRFLITIISLFPFLLQAQNGSVSLVSAGSVYIEGKTGSTFTISVETGKPAQVSNLVGISFHLNWDNPSAIRLESKSTGGFFGDNPMVISQDYPSYIEIGLASSSGGKSGSGMLAGFQFSVVTDVTQLIPVHFTITQLSAIDKDGNKVNLSPVNTPLTINLCRDIPLNLTSANGREYWKEGAVNNITWNSDIPGNVKLEYSLNNGLTWVTIVESTPAANKIYSWTVPGTPSEECRIRITSLSEPQLFDVSEHDFTICPAANDQVYGRYYPDDQTVALFHFDDNFRNSSYASADGNLVGQGSAFVASTPFSAGKSYHFDGDDYITVAHSSALNLAGDWTLETWFKLDEYTYGPYFINKPGDVDLYFSNYSLQTASWWDNVVYGFYFSQNSTRIGLSMPKPELNKWYHVTYIRDSQKSQLRLLLHDEKLNLVSSQVQSYTETGTLLSSKPLEIGRGLKGNMDEMRISNVVRKFEALKLTAPNGGETLTAGTLANITWTSSNILKIKIEYSTNNGSGWTVLADNVDATLKSYSWNVPDAVSSACKVRISDSGNATLFDVSDQSFSIVKTTPASVSVTFSVDLSYQIKNGIFKPSTDKVYIKGTFNDWSEQNPMSDGNGSGIYTCSLTLNPSTSYEFKYFITSAGAENSGWELNVGSGGNGNRKIVTNTSSSTLPKDYFNNLIVSAKAQEKPANAVVFHPNQPNPFSGSTTFRFYVPFSTDVDLTIFDGYGRKVATLINSFRQQGTYSVVWDAQMFPGGVYFCRFRAGDYVCCRKIIHRK